MKRAGWWRVNAARGERQSLEALERGRVEGCSRGDAPGGGVRGDGGGVAARGGVLRPSRASRVSGVDGEVLGAAEVLVASREVERDRCADAGQLALIDDGLLPIELAEGARASLDRRVRAADRLRDLATAQKTRIRELARQVMPMLDEAVTGVLGRADIAVLERYGDPRPMLRAGPARVTALMESQPRPSRSRPSRGVAGGGSQGGRALWRRPGGRVRGPRRGAGQRSAAVAGQRNRAACARPSTRPRIKLSILQVWLAACPGSRRPAGRSSSR